MPKKPLYGFIEGVFISSKETVWFKRMVLWLTPLTSTKIIYTMTSGVR